MAKLTVPIVVDMDDILKELEKYDFVEVVRCKECKHRIERDGQCPLMSTGDPYYDTEPQPDFFCADGKRREE